MQTKRTMEDALDFLSSVLVQDSGPHHSAVLMQGGFVGQTDENGANLQRSFHRLVVIYGVEPGFGFNVIQKDFLP